MRRLTNLNERLEGIEADFSLGGVLEQIKAVNSRVDEFNGHLLKLRRVHARSHLDEVYRYETSMLKPQDVALATELARTYGGTMREIEHVDEPETVVEETIQHWNRLLLAKGYFQG